MEFEDSFAGRLAQEQKGEAGPDAYGVVLSRVRDSLSKEFSAEQLTNAGPSVTEKATRTAREALMQYNSEALTQSKPRIMIHEDQFVQMVLADLLGMGAIEPLLKDETIEDIAVNGPNEVMVFRPGGWEEVDIRFDSPTRLLEILNRGIAHSNRKANMVTPIADAVHSNRKANMVTPIADAVLQGRERISVVTYPIANPHPTAVIRIPRAKELTMEDLIQPAKNAGEKEKVHIEELPDYESLMQGGMLTAAAGKYLFAAVHPKGTAHPDYRGHAGDRSLPQGR
jgi:hypothetical protein